LIAPLIFLASSVDWKGRRKRLWVLAFFGLADEYKIYLHESLFNLVHFGNFDYDAVYSMPVQYRNFYIKKLINIKEKENAEIDKAQGTMSGGSTPVSKKNIKGR
jgi:hypothetical protein